MKVNKKKIIIQDNPSHQNWSVSNFSLFSFFLLSLKQRSGQNERR
jgi:hypothetical protein